MDTETFLRKNGVIKLRSLFLLFFVFEMALSAIVSAIPYSNPSLVAQLQSEQNSAASLGLVGTIFYIFPHNLLIATLELIPLFGQFLFVFSMVETSLILSASAASANISGLFSFLILLLLPDSLIELPSYAISSANSVYLLYILIRHTTLLRSKIRKVMYMYLFTVLELFIAGTIESGILEMEKTLPSPTSFLYALLLWIVAIPVIYLLIRLFRHINRDEYGPSFGDITEPLSV
ncbi:MAG: stage II sporulation protein M [Thermoplasmataceae archaeon]